MKDVGVLRLVTSYCQFKNCGSCVNNEHSNTKNIHQPPNNVWLLNQIFSFWWCYPGGFQVDSLSAWKKRLQYTLWWCISFLSGTFLIQTFLCIVFCNIAMVNKIKNIKKWTYKRQKWRKGLWCTTKCYWSNELSVVRDVKTTTETSLLISCRPAVNRIIHHHTYSCSLTMQQLSSNLCFSG